VLVDAERWLRDLPAELGPQRDVITGLLNEARKDARIRLFVVGCSIGRGAADALSDVDALYGVATHTPTSTPSRSTRTACRSISW
jgi:hypothetical protein